jgi:hypothetical protein
MTITGPNGYSVNKGEYIRPFKVFFDGKTFPSLGQYTLTALPDGLVEKKKVITFNIVPGTVTAVKLWDATTKTIMNANFTGGEVCNNTFVNFEAVMSYAETSKMTLTSTNGYSRSITEYGLPFSIFNDSNGDFLKKLSNGNYTLTIYPDEAVSSNMKVIPFDVITC